MENIETIEIVEMNEVEEYSKDTVEKLLDLIKKEKHISLVSKELGLTDFEVLGLIHELIDDGYNIIV